MWNFGGHEIHLLIPKFGQNLNFYWHLWKPLDFLEKIFGDTLSPHHHEQEVHLQQFLRSGVSIPLWMWCSSKTPKHFIIIVFLCCLPLLTGNIGMPHNFQTCHQFKPRAQSCQRPKMLWPWPSPPPSLDKLKIVEIHYFATFNKSDLPSTKQNIPKHRSPLFATWFWTFGGRRPLIILRRGVLLPILCSAHQT